MLFDLAIIIINYNSSEYTIACLHSILNNTSKNLSYQIIVIDNSSVKRDYQNLEHKIKKIPFPDLQLYRSRINTGFGGGNMMGVQYAKANYYLFINNDTILVKDPISICYEFMESTPGAAVCGIQILDDNKIPQVSFDHFTSFSREVFGKNILELLQPKTKPKRKKKYSEPIMVNYVNGSFMFFRAKDFEDVGGFDNNIFLYFEESDICFRLLNNGKKTFFIPNASYQHFQGKSVDSTDWRIKTKIELKTSMFYVIRKNYGYLHYQALRIVFLLRYAIVSLVKPKYFKLWYRILLGMPISKSLKQEQKLH
ncbi:glycosyltransferase family 2 protein [Eudoraea chungangensis]|uniref:glycosyltransferase family 2 protein n=1 Tax=Eudoraea chungangensis TaxID=1481905 RepID=UPI0023EC18E0|nr:glycosyltransferase family 2 protein [Eudoraea chungangensis]